MTWWFLPAVALVWVFWGKYGVQVHSAIDGFKKSGMRAMISLSTAYVVVALGALGFDPDASFSGAGFTRGLGAGLITTLGAWGIVFGNRYVKGGQSIVMPLVFGGAPVVNSFYVMWRKRGRERPSNRSRNSESLKCQQNRTTDRAPRSVRHRNGSGGSENPQPRPRFPR